MDWYDKRLHGKFPNTIKEVGDVKSWKWLTSGWVKKSTEAIITAARDQVLRTNWIKASVDKQECFPLCRVCHSADESAMLIARGICNLQNVYIRSGMTLQ